MTPLRFALLVLALFAPVVSCAQPASETSSKQFTGDARVDLPTLLPSGTLTVELMDSLYVPPRRLELTERLRLAILRNPDWVYESNQEVAAGRTPPFDSRLGFTRQEWDEIVNLWDDPSDMSLVPTGSESLAIEHDGDFIRFRSSGHLDVLNDISFNLSRSSVYWDTLRLVSRDPDTSTSRNALHASWKGYSWSYSQWSREPGISQVEEYSIAIRLLDQTRRTFVNVRSRTVLNRVTIDSVDHSFIFD